MSYKNSSTVIAEAVSELELRSMFCLAKKVLVTSALAVDKCSD